jgi:hypothetical protein
MSIYMAQDGSWGVAEGLIVIDDCTWTDADYELMSIWNERTRNEYAIYCDNNTPYLTPTEWEKQQ